MDQDDRPLEERAQQRFEQLVRIARDYHEETLFKRLERSVRYYNGESEAPISGKVKNLVTDEITEHGEKLVITECKDTADQLLVEISRSLLLERDLIRFRARDFRTQEEAEAAQAYVRAQFFDECDGVDLIEEMLQAWTQTILVIMTVWDQEIEVTSHQGFALKVEEIQVLEVDEEVEITSASESQIAPGSFDVQFERSSIKGRHRVEVIPPEELLIDPYCNDPKNAMIVGHRSRKLVTDVVSEGFDLETVLQHSESQDSYGRRRDQIDRSRRLDNQFTKHDRVDDRSLEWVETVHAWCRLDMDGDGIAEWYHVVALGEEPIVVAIEPSDRPGILISTAKRIQNSPIGRSVVEETMDLQDWATGLIRADMDNLREAVKAKTMINKGDTTAMQDVANGKKNIRVEDPTSVVNFVTPYVGANARPMIEEVERRRTKRTGISDAGIGLTPNALKGQTVEGVDAIVSAPQKRADFYARAFCNRALLPLFKEIYRQAVENASGERIIELRGEEVPVDPRSWKVDARMSVELNTGTSMQPDIIMAAERAIGMATQVYQALGPKASAYIGDAEISNMLDDFFGALGVGDIRRYVKAVDQEIQLPPPGPTEDDKERENKLRVEQLKAAAGMQREQLKSTTELVVAGVKEKADLAKTGITAQAAIRRDNLDVEAARAS